MVPTITKLTIKRISQDEIAILLIVEDATNAQRLDFAIDEYSLAWNYKNEEFVTFYLRAPRLGSYSFDVDKRETFLLPSANVLCVAYRLETGQLECLPPRQLNLVSPPNY